MALWGEDEFRRSAAVTLATLDVEEANGTTEAAAAATVPAQLTQPHRSLSGLEAALLGASKRSRSP